MATRSIVLTPGVTLETTPSGNQTQYQASNLIRFSPSGYVQKLGGWTKFYPNPIGSVVRALHAFDTLSGADVLAVGAEAELAVIVSGTLTDITPLTQTDNAVTVDVSTTAGSPVATIVDPGISVGPGTVVVIQTPIAVGGLTLLGSYPVIPVDLTSYSVVASTNATSTVSNGGILPRFSTLAGSAITYIRYPNHGYSVGSTFPVPAATTVGGVVFFGLYPVLSVIDADNFTIANAIPATLSDITRMNHDLAILTYYIFAAAGTTGTGFGVGPFGAGVFGGGVVFTPTVGTPLATTDWDLDNFGGYLIATPLNGPIFSWIPNSGSAVATVILGAPTINTGAFVAMPEEIIVAYGSSVEEVQDPLLLNWCDAGQFTTWLPAVTNQAGSFRLPRGSRIVGAIQGPITGLIWTDISIWTMSYIGQPLVFSFNEIATGCGMIGKHAAATLGTTVFWMSQTQFFMLPAGGSVTPVPCAVWDFVFQNLDTANVEKIRAAANSQFGEIAWYFPQAGGSGENVAYVKFCPLLNAWDFGVLGRSAWIDQSVFGPPIGADPVSFLIYQHETSPDADGVAMTPSATTGYFALEDGQDVSTVNMCYPDFKWQVVGGSTSATVDIVFNYTNYPSGAPIYTSPTYVSTNNGPPFNNVRFRARLASMTVSSNDIGSFWRWGNPRLRIAPDGRL